MALAYTQTQKNLAPQTVPTSTYRPEQGTSQAYGNAAAAEELTCSSTGEAGGVVGRAPGPVKSMLETAAAHPPLSTIASYDQDSSSISNHDWCGTDGHLPALLPYLRELAPTPADYQDCIWFFYEMTTTDDIGVHQRVYDIASGTLREEPIPEGVAPEALDVGCQAARGRLTDKLQIIDNELVEEKMGPDVIHQPADGTERDNFSDSISEAMDARSKLVTDFGFDPSDRSIEAVRALKGKLDVRQLEAFIEEYLTAFFASGASDERGLSYGLIEFDKGIGLRAFFGDPPGCDQLPDGRAIIDCKGFSSVSQILFEELSGGPVNQRHSTEITYQFSVAGVHQMALIRSGTEVMVIDNDEVKSLHMAAPELAHLDALHESCFATGEEIRLSGSIDLKALPTLGDYLATIFHRYRIQGPVRAHWYSALPVIHADGQ